MVFSTSSSQQTTKPSQKSISGTQKLRHVGSKILKKMKLSKSKDDKDREELASTEIQVARFATLIRPSEGPQIVDLGAMRRNIRPQSTRTDTQRSSMSRSPSHPHAPELCGDQSSQTPCLPTKTDAPPRENRQQGGFVLRTTADRRSDAAISDDVADYDGYELLDGEDSDLDWSLLDLPEQVYQRLANESRHSLI